MRKDPLITDYTYHIFNRGVNKQDIFFNESDYRHFLAATLHYITKNDRFSYQKFNRYQSLNNRNDTGSLQVNNPKVKIIAYCLMTNHFHFLIKQLIDDGITSFMRHLSNSWSHHLNIKYERVGPLYQGRFKNVLVETDEQLIHTSRYIHLNPLVANIVLNLKEYPWSSYLKYISDKKDDSCDPSVVLNLFQSRRSYEEFVLDQEEYSKELEKIKHLALDF